MRDALFGHGGEAGSVLGVVGLTLLLSLPVLHAPGEAGSAAWDGADGPPVHRTAAGACYAVGDTTTAPRTEPPEFYTIDMVPTGNVHGTGTVRGTVRVGFRASPFDVAVSDRGTFHRQLVVDMSGLRPPARGAYVVWVTDRDVEEIRKLGTLGDDMRLEGQVAITKFLVVLTLERNPDAVTGTWEGPIVHRGMSKSGFMHTMAGHGPFQSEPCAGYGFQ